MKREQEMLAAKEAALESSRTTLAEMLSQRKDLEVELERLEARIRTVEARKAISAISIDDSQLARVKQLIKEIDKRLDVEDKVLDAEGNFGGLIPVESTEEEVQAEDILERIESRFGTPAAAEPSMATAQAQELKDPLSRSPCPRTSAGRTRSLTLSGFRHGRTVLQV